MRISIGRQHSAFGETHWRKFSRWVGLSRGSGLSTAALLIAFTMTCTGSSAARDRGSTEGQKTEIPFNLCNGNLIIVKATVGSFKNVNLILDTGTSPTAINQVMADRLNVRGKAALLQTLTGTIRVQSVTLPRIQIGPLHADSITGVVEDLTYLERSLGISLGGIAGLDILHASSFVIDYRRHKIIFGPIAASEKAVHFETQIPYLSVKAKIAGQQVRLLVDSGTGGLLVYRNRLRTAVEQLHIDPNASISTPAGGGTHLRWLSTEVSLEKGSLGHATLQSLMSTPIRKMISMASLGSQQWDFARCLSTSKMGCSDGID